MVTVTYGSGDAVYGSGVYNLAVYGEYGPTLSVTGFGSTSSLGTITVAAEANKNLVGNQLVTTQGVITVAGEAVETLAGVSGTSSLGSVTISASTGLTGQQLTSSLGLVKANITEYLLGVSATSSSGLTTETGIANHTLSSATSTGFAGSTTETGVVFNFEAVKERYDRERTVILSAKRTTSFDRTTEVA